jgi:putative DNA primase/helicase
MTATPMPGWAALSTTGSVALALPLIVQHVGILTDHDNSGAGERAAHIAAERWIAKDRRVRIAMPSELGTAGRRARRPRYACIAEASDAAA